MDGQRRPELSCARSLFFGVVQDDPVFPFPDALDAEAKDTLALLLEPLDRFFETRVDSRKIDHEARIPPDLLQELKNMGLFGLQIPQELGGLGLSNTAYARLFETIAAGNASIAVMLGAHQSIGLKGILLFGTEAQKHQYLPKLASGEWVAAFCLTEPTSGSDAASIRTRAEPSQDNAHFVLNGGKIWITNGGMADVMTVFAQTPVADEHGDVRDRITAFLVERSFGGVVSGKEEDKLGIKGSSTTAVYFENCKVPAQNVLGEVGGGFKVAMTVLNNGRFGLAAGSVGGMKALIHAAAQHADTRKQFGRSLREFGLIKEKFARMSMAAYASESMTYMTCGLMDRDRGAGDYGVEAAMCKVFASESLWYVANEALQVMGGLGYMKEYPFERVLRDARINLIFEGTNEILRLFVALSGLQAPGQHLRELAHAIKDPLQNYGMLFGELAQRVKQRIEGEKVERAHPRVRTSATQIENDTVQFGRAVDALLRHHGKGILEQQLVLERVADIAIDLYAMLAVVSRASTALETKHPSSEHEARLCTSFCAEADRRIRRCLRAIELGSDKNGDVELEAIADAVFERGGFVPPHLLGR